MFLGNHIIAHLCEEDFNDVGILKALSKVLKDRAMSIENGPTWKKILEDIGCVIPPSPAQ